MTRMIVKPVGSLLAFVCLSASANAHMLPISYLTVVPDETHVHVEFLLNPFDLQFFSEIDKNHNGVLDPNEMEAFEQLATPRLVDLIEVRVDGKVIKPDVAGADLAVGSHHVVLRAHYPIDAREVPISIRCNLWNILRSGNVIIVKYVNNGHTQSRLLDSGKRFVTFDPAEKPQ